MAVDMKHAAHRASLAPMRRIHDDWRRCARQYAEANGFDVRFVFELLEEQTNVHLYGGETWDEAQARAWSDCLAILERTAA